MPAAGRGHRRRRVAHRQAHHAGRRRPASGATPRRRSDGCWSPPTNATPCARARAIASSTANAQAGNASPQPASTSTAPPRSCAIARHRGAVGAAVAQVRRVLRDARNAVRREPLRIRVDQRPRGRLGHRPRSHRRARAHASRARRSSVGCEARHRLSAPRARRAPARRSSSTTRSFDSCVTPAMCGVSSRFGQPASGEPAGSGSCSNTSSAAPPSCPLAAPRRPRLSSTTPPRAVLIRIAPRFIAAMRARVDQVRASPRPAARAA